MATNKQYTVKKEIYGKEYVAQYSGLSVATRMVDECYVDGTSNLSVTKIAEYVFKYGIVEPKGLTIDDFDNLDELNEVVAFGRETLQGKFRDDADTGAASEKGKK